MVATHQFAVNEGEEVGDNSQKHERDTWVVDIWICLVSCAYCSVRCAEAVLLSICLYSDKRKTSVTKYNLIAKRCLECEGEEFEQEVAQVFLNITGKRVEGPHYPADEDS